MSPHPNLETLMIGQNYNNNHVHGLEQLSHSNFPCLSVFLTTARNLDLTALTPNPSLEKLVVGQVTKVIFQPPLGMSFPKLQIIRTKDLCKEKYLAGFTKLQML